MAMSRVRLETFFFRSFRGECGDISNNVYLKRINTRYIKRIGHVCHFYHFNNIIFRII
jgi:hypothetical protein